MPKEKIFIVEDQEVVYTNIKFLLGRKGYVVSGIATSGKDALKQLDKALPDLILMDINLPGDIDGIETTKKIKEKWDVPVIYLSAYDSEYIINRAKETDVEGYITKDDSLQKQLPVVIEFALYKHRSKKEKFKSRRAQRECEEKYRSILNSTLDAVILLNKFGNVIFWNNAAARILGFSEKEALGKNFYDMMLPHTSIDLYKTPFKEYYSTGKGELLDQFVELTYYRHDEDMMHLELYFNNFQLNGKDHACMILRDATLRKETEGEFERIIEELHISRELIENNANEFNILNMQLSESKEKLKELNSSKDKFFSIIAHDLKGPFQGLLGYSQLLSDNLDGLSKDEIKDFSGELHDSASQLFKLLENLLEWSRIQRGVMEFNPQNIYLSQIAEMSVEILTPGAAQKKVKIINDVPEELQAFADLNMVNTVIRNLLSNAIKFTGEDGRIVISAMKADDYFVQVSVSDNGVGMDEEVKNSIFRIDKHHSQSGTNGESGTGLGLVLCKDLVEKNEGTITVESNLNEGSNFIFTLPTAREES